VCGAELQSCCCCCYCLSIATTIGFYLTGLLCTDHSRLGWILWRSPQVQPSENAGLRFLQAGYTSCQPSNSVEAVKRPVTMLINDFYITGSQKRRAHTRSELAGDSMENIFPSVVEKPLKW